MRRYKTDLAPVVRLSPKARCGGSSRAHTLRGDLENGVRSSQGDSVHEFSGKAIFFSPSLPPFLNQGLEAKNKRGERVNKVAKNTVAEG